MNKWTIGGFVVVLVLGGLYFMTPSDDGTNSQTGADISLDTPTAVEEAVVEVSSEIEQIELEEIEADAVIDELESAAF